MKASKNFPKIKTAKDKAERKERIKWKRKQKKIVSRHGWRLRTFIKQKGVCAYCKYVTPWEFWTVDHKTPISKGGASVKGNLIGACNACNAKKGNDSRLYDFF